LLLRRSKHRMGGCFSLSEWQYGSSRFGPFHQISPADGRVLGNPAGEWLVKIERVGELRFAWLRSQSIPAFSAQFAAHWTCRAVRRHALTRLRAHFRHRWHLWDQ